MFCIGWDTAEAAFCLGMVFRAALRVGRLFETRERLQERSLGSGFVIRKPPLADFHCENLRESIRGTTVAKDWRWRNV
jgi:hypothetical protein